MSKLGALHFPLWVLLLGSVTPFIPTGSVAEQVVAWGNPTNVPVELTDAAAISAATRFYRLKQ